jgi:phage recombination protein Bet
MTEPTTGAVGLLTANEMLRGLHTVRAVLAPDLTDDELKLFAMVANRSGLDPFAKQIYAVKRKGRVTFQTGIDGYRSIAARTGMYDGQDEPEFGPAVDGHPESATVRVYRKGVTRAIAATAFWDEYKPAPSNSGDGDIMWRRMPHVMIAKVAEALALRKAFPYDPERREGIGADLYTADEMEQAERPEPVARPTLAERAAANVAEVVSVTIEEPAVQVLQVSNAYPPEQFQPIDEPEDATPTVSVGLSVETLKDLCVRNGKSTVRIAKAIGCDADLVGARVKAMSPVERGVLADELDIDWRGAL